MDQITDVTESATSWVLVSFRGSKRQSRRLSVWSALAKVAEVKTMLSTVLKIAFTKHEGGMALSQIGIALPNELRQIDGMANKK